jgi:hypothetical protein
MRLLAVTPGQLAQHAKQRSFFKLYSFLPVSALRFLCTLTGSKHLGQAESYRCCTIGTILCDWHIDFGNDNVMVFAIFP